MKLYYYISIVIISILSIIVIFQSRKIHKQNNEIHRCESLYEASNVANNQIFSQFGRMMNIIYFSSLERIDKGYMVVDSENKRYGLLDLVDQPKLIFKFSEYHCHSCVQNIIRKLKELELLIGINNIIIIVDRFSSDYMLWIKTENDIKSPVYYCLTKKILINAIEKNDLPYLFTLDKSGKIDFPLPVTDYIELISELYFNSLVVYFNNLI